MTDDITETVSIIKNVNNNEIVIEQCSDTRNYIIISGRKKLVLCSNPKILNQTIFKFYFDNVFIFKEVFNESNQYQLDLKFRTHFSLNMTDEEMKSLINCGNLNCSQLSVHSNSGSRTCIKQIETNSSIVITKVKNYIDLHDFFSYYFLDDESIYIDKQFIKKESNSLSLLLEHSSFLDYNLFKSLVSDNFFLELFYPNGVFKYFCFDSKNNRLSIFDIDNHCNLINSFEFKKNYEECLQFSLEMVFKICLYNIKQKFKELDISDVKFENIDTFLSVLEMIEC